MQLNAPTDGVAMTSALSAAECTAAAETIYEDGGPTQDNKHALATQTMTHMPTHEKRLMSGLL